MASLTQDPQGPSTKPSGHMDRNVLLNLPIVNQSSNYQLLGLACHQGKLWLKGILRGFRNPAEFLDHIATLLHWACCSWLCCNLEDCILHMQDFNTLPNCWNTELTKASSWLTLPEKKMNLQYKHMIYIMIGLQYTSTVYSKLQHTWKTVGHLAGLRTQNSLLWKSVLID